MKPTETYPQQKITEIDGLLAEAEKKEENYKAAVSKGDAALSTNDYEAAKVAFNEASGLKPDEQYPKDKLAEIETITLKNQKAEEEYNAAIQNGDDAITGNDYKNAKKFYNTAILLKPDEQYPKDQLQKIESKEADLARLEKEYKDAVAMGDAAMKDNKLEDAKAAYTKALEAKPEEQYPKDKIAGIDKELAANAKVEEEYQAAIAEGDAALAAKTYESARSAFEKASKLKPSEDYPKDKITEIEKVLAELKNKEENYTKAITKADAAFADSKWEDAKAAYQEALTLKDEEYPKSKITEADQKIAELAAQLEKEEKLEADYQVAIKKGDLNSATNKYAEAIAAYQEASKLKPEETYPVEKIAEIEAKMNKIAEEQAEQERLAALEKEYTDLIASADASFQQKDLDAAKADYEAALKLKDTESYPSEKLEEIKTIKKEAADLEKNYSDQLAKADKLLAEEKWEEAKDSYTKALTIKDDQYPKDKIEEIENKLEEIAAEQAEITIKKEKEAELNNKIQTLISEGDGFVPQQKWDKAIEKYNEALTLREDQIIKDKIEEVNTKKAAALAEEQRKIEEMKQKDADNRYAFLIEKGEEEIALKLYDKARENFEEALTIKDEQLPKDKLLEIDALIASEADAEAQKKAAEAQAKIDAEYQALIAEADVLFGSASYAEARAKYEAALKVKDEAYPKEKIAEIATRLNELADEAAQKEAAEAQAKVDAEYQALIAEADVLFGSASYAEARAKYEAARKVKDEAYPKEKIAEIATRLNELADEEAQKEAAEAQAKIDAEYQALIAEADVLFDSASYAEARAKYEAALKVKDEAYPKEKIAEIATRLNELADEAAQKEAAEAQAKVDAEYQALIAEADVLFGSASYAEARAKYEAALKVKDEAYPKEKIAEIATRLNELADEEAQKEAAAAQAKIDAEYRALIAEADAFLNNESYANARDKYQAALDLKNTPYPQEKIKEIEAKMTSLAEAEARVAAEKEKAKQETEYLQLINEADLLLESEEFENAKSKYKEALAVKDDQYPKNKIDEIDTRLAALANEKQEEIRLAKQNTDYLAAIEKGDQALASGDYKVALTAFNNASKIKSDENYPKNKIAEINDLLTKQNTEKEEAERVINEQYAASITKAQTAFDLKEYEQAISAYQEAQEIKPSESLPAQKIKEIKDIQQQILADKEAIKIKKEREAENEQAYQTAILAGDKLYAEQKYNEAENEYRLAQSLKSSENYPLEQMDKINNILNKREAAERAAEEKKRKEEEDARKYDELIVSGDEALNRSALRIARREYEAALKIKPGEAYPSSQLLKVNALIEKELLAKEENNETEEKPIQIQTGPKATITGDAEAEIERMYQEMWDKQNSDKSSIIEKKSEIVKKYNEENKERELARRQNAMKMIENISISIQEQNNMPPDLNLQNYEVIKEKEKDLKAVNEEYERDSERRRNNSSIDQVDFFDRLTEYNIIKNEENTVGRKERVDNQYSLARQLEEKRALNHVERIDVSNREAEEQLEAIRTFQDDRAEITLNKRKEDQVQRETDWNETQQIYNKASDKKIANSAIVVQEKNEVQKNRREEITEKTDDIIADRQQEIEGKALKQTQFGRENNESFKNNQLEIEEKTKVLENVNESREKDAEKRRNSNIDKDFYIGEKKIRKDKEAANYPQGVTEEIIENQNNSTTIRRIVVNGTQTDIYEKTLYSWGGIFYTKNGNNIGKETWDKESK